MRSVYVERTGLAMATEVRHATSLWQRFRGLMLKRKLPRGEGLAIRPCTSIHMMFMRFPIDAVFYDDDGRVINVARNVRPWIGVAFGGHEAKAVLEVPAGAARGVEPGDYLKFAA